jgi:SAM-dependent methyltransferase
MTRHGDARLEQVDRDRHRARTLAAYDRLAEVWDETDDNLFNEALERSTVRSLLRMPLARCRVLDAGCAGGAHAAWLAEQGCAVVGFDLSRAMVRQAAVRCGGRAQFLVADLAAPPFLGGAFDGILCSLALHYLEDMSTALQGFARALRPAGWLLVTLDHPFGSEAGEPQGGYFATRLVTETWSKKGVDVEQSFWRRPLGATIGALADAGFYIERIGEPELDDVMRRRFPQHAEKIEGVPTFIAYLARKASVI